MRKKRRQLGCASLICWYCAMTGVAAASSLPNPPPPAGEGTGGGGRRAPASGKGSAVIGGETVRASGGNLTLTCHQPERATEDRHGRDRQPALSGDPRGGRVVRRPRALSQRRRG